MDEVVNRGIDLDICDDLPPRQGALYFPRSREHMPEPDPAPDGDNLQPFEAAIVSVHSDTSEEEVTEPYVAEMTGVRDNMDSDSTVSIHTERSPTPDTLLDISGQSILDGSNTYLPFNYEVSLKRNWSFYWK